MVFVKLEIDYSLGLCFTTRLNVLHPVDDNLLKGWQVDAEISNAKEQG